MYTVFQNDTLGSSFHNMIQDICAPIYDIRGFSWNVEGHFDQHIMSFYDKFYI